MSDPMTPPKNLLAGSSIAADTRLPATEAEAELNAADHAALLAAVARHPELSLGWTRLAEQALAEHTSSGDVAAYAYARTGYHRGLDALRRAGWRGAGPIPWEHQPNQGFLRALWALAVAADRIGEAAEAERCSQFLRDSTEAGYQHLAAGRH